MRGGFAQFAFLAGALAVLGDGAVARGMRPIDACRVVGASKLADKDVSSSICVEIARAMAKHAPTARYSVEVRVLSPSRLTAVLTVNGRLLPDQNMAVSDGKVAASSIRHFAETLAAAAAVH